MILLLFILLLKALFGIIFVLYGDIYLSPDEAQYWLWSQFLDFGYYSKPPAITWEIALGTSVFGSTELGVRIGGIVFSFLIGMATFYLGKACGLSEKRSLYSGLIIALCPIGLIGSFAATTDLGFVFFWIMAFSHICFSLKEDKPPSFFLLGLFIFLGALFKWTMFIIWIPIFVGIFYYPILRNKKLLGTLFFSLLAFVPSLYWNSNHEFSTFKHVINQSFNLSNPDPLFFSVAQILLLFPIFFIFFACAVYRIPKLIRPLRFTTAWAFIFFTLYIAAAFYQEMLVNWLVFAFPLAAVAAGHIINKKWIITGCVLSVLLSVSVIFLPALQKHNLLIPYSLNPFKECLGWPYLKNALELSGYDPQKDVLVSDSYELCSIASFYSQGQKRSYFLNLLNKRKNQFSFWPQLEKGSSGIFMVVGNGSQDEIDKIKLSYQKILKPYFEEIDDIEFYPLFSSNSTLLKWSLLFKFRGYSGLIPKESLKY